MMKMREYAAWLTIDEIEETLAWIADRANYCRACGMESSGEDNAFRHILLGELNSRRNATPA